MPASSTYVLYAVAPDEIDTDIQQMRAVLDFIAGHGNEPIVVFFIEQSFELARTIGVGALRDNEERLVLYMHAPYLKARTVPSDGTSVTSPSAFLLFVEPR